MTTQNLPAAPAESPPRQGKGKWILWRFSQGLMILVALLAGAVWYSSILRPEEQRMLGVWAAPELWLGERSEAIEFQPDRTTVPFYAQNRGSSHSDGFNEDRMYRVHIHRQGDLLIQSGKLGDWRRRGDNIYITRRDPELNLIIAKVRDILKSLLQGRGLPEDGTKLRVVLESENRMEIDDLRSTPPRRIIFFRLITTPDVPRSAETKDVETTILRNTQDPRGIPF